MILFFRILDLSLISMEKGKMLHARNFFFKKKIFKCNISEFSILMGRTENYSI